MCDKSLKMALSTGITKFVKGNTFVKKEPQVKFLQGFHDANLEHFHKENWNPMTINPSILNPYSSANGTTTGGWYERGHLRLIWGFLPDTQHSGDGQAQENELITHLQLKDLEEPSHQSLKLGSCYSLTDWRAISRSTFVITDKGGTMPRLLNVRAAGKQGHVRRVNEWWCH